MKLLEVNSPAHQREFFEMAVRLYKGEKNWIRPLNEDIEDLFHAEANKLFRHKAEAIRWLLKNDRGETIGRVAAVINAKWQEKQPAGATGLYECVNDSE